MEGSALLGVLTRAILTVIGHSSNPSLYKWFGPQESNPSADQLHNVSFKKRGGVNEALSRGNAKHAPPSTKCHSCILHFKSQKTNIHFTRPNLFHPP